ncbi:hypothetical protein [Pseudonocardia humida]|uniref:Uncharacterized protein n=1 Tax=Pseudonocardia humida TaxID=2800819 RepID=A0ABT0ZTI8_9PSEU|nr:hypothetical protein [Pseudonocardia humida]MCO1654042.1 hypothetical protein [Pseudonocardia humida]
MDYIWLFPLFGVLMAGAIAATVLLTIRRNFRRLLETAAHDAAAARRGVFVGEGRSSGSQPSSWSDSEWTTTYIGSTAHGYGPAHDHGWPASSEHGGSSSCSDSGWSSSSDSGSSSSSSSSDSGSSSSSSSSDSGSSSC